MEPQPIGPGTTPGPDAVLPLRSPDAVLPGALIASHYRHCFGCGAEHPAGLHMQVQAGPELSLSASFEVSPAHQGAPGLAHGGLLTAAVDEVLGALNWLLMRPAVTARLETNFVRPVPVGSVLDLQARITGVEGRKVYTAAIGRLGPDGPIAVTASALFIQVEIGHFRSHGRPAEVALAIADGDAGPPAEMNP
ncbi:MAG TPA: PaaI family thioesterase [Motilibacterales bacterium]|jgi:acyl-coenzyme A thioesterase PaaI-like protein|nr:PaaI family thioesterase [Motilibacterales bacterium]